MSLDAASANLPGVPEELVMRSARARAAAQGTDVDAVLSSWGGGAALPDTPAPAAAPAGDATTTPEPEPESAPAAVATAEPVAPAVPAGPAREVIYVTPDESEPLRAVPLGERVRTGLLLGGALGAIAGLVTGVAAFALAGGGMVIVEEAPGMAIDPTRTLIVLALIFGVAGLVIARTTAALPARFDPNRDTHHRGGVIGTVGLVLGAGIGAATAGMVGGGATELVGQEPLVGVPAIGSFITIGIMAVVMGAVVGVLAQVIALPKGLDESAEQDSEAVQKRLVTGYLVPIVVLLSMALVIVGVGTLFLQFPAISPVIGIIIAASLLTFGFLSTSRPNTKIGLSDVAIFVAGLAIVVVVIASVAWQIGGGHGEDEGDHGGGTEDVSEGGDAPAGDAWELTLPA
jgi:MFS family permease